ncbi:hypothetical protein BHE74_00006120 [Ensete ventricosum]|nr:hypothetical protein BHE74_00006120 [Ensete ventricosum]
MHPQPATLVGGMVASVYRYYKRPSRKRLRLLATSPRAITPGGAAWPESPPLQAAWPQVAAPHPQATCSRIQMERMKKVKCPPL